MSSPHSLYSLGAFQEDYRLWDSSSYLSSTSPHILLSHLFEPTESMNESPISPSCDEVDVDIDNLVPILRRIPCPVINCQSFLTEVDLNPLPDYQKAYATALSNIFARRTCSLYSILNCDSRPNDLNKMVCLGCSHFYHPECFLHYITSEITNLNNHNIGSDSLGGGNHIICIQCQLTHQTCSCYECYHRVDKSLTSRGEHIINETDMKSFYSLILNSKLKMVRSDVEQYEIIQQIDKLFSRWLEMYTNRSITATISQINGNKLFQCECGEAYEIERVPNDEQEEARAEEMKSTSLSEESLKQISGTEERQEWGEEKMDPEAKSGRHEAGVVIAMKTFNCPNPSCRKSYCAKVAPLLTQISLPFAF